MKAIELLDLGYRELVPIEPGTKRPAKPINGKWITANDRGPVTEADALEWDKHGASLALRGNYFPFIDSDVDDAEIGEIIKQEALDFLGPAPIRYSRPPRFGLLYSVEDKQPFGKKLTLSFNIQGIEKVQQIEIFGNNNNFNIAGVHPSGSQYYWEYNGVEMPSFLPPDELTEITLVDAQNFIAHIRNKLSHHPRVKSFSKEDTGISQINDNLLAPSDYELALTLGFVNNTYQEFNRNKMIAMCGAIKGSVGLAEVSEDQERKEALGFALFSEFSDRCLDAAPYNQEQLEHIWESTSVKAGYGSVLHYAMHNPVYAQQVCISGFEIEEEDNHQPELISLEPASQAALFSHIELADRYLKQHKDLVRFYKTGDSQTKVQWILRENVNDSLWKIDNKNFLADSLRRYCESQAKECFRMLEPKEATAQFKKLCKAEEQARLATQLTSYSSVCILPEECNTDPDVLNTPEGLFSLKTGRGLHPSESPTFHTQTTSVAPDWNCPTPHFDEFLNFVTGGELKLEVLLQKFIGYACTGRVQEQIFLFAYGDGGTGKGMFIRILEAILGDYATTVNANVVAADYRGLRDAEKRHPVELMSFMGKRLIVIQEFGDQDYWIEQRVKMLTGGDTITARGMHQNFTSWIPTHTLFMAGNRLPECRTVDQALLRRVRIIPFKHKATEEMIAENFENRIKQNELPGILAWAIDGAISWYRSGLGEMPEEVIADTKEYFENSDLLGNWLQENTVKDTTAFSPIKPMYQRWAQYQKESGTATVDSIRVFGDKLALRGYPRKKGDRGAVRGHGGLKLIDPNSDERVLCHHCMGTGSVPLTTGETE